jgi:hypothetical protein
MEKNIIEGSRIKLLEMKDPYPVSSGSWGTVDFIDDEGQIHVNWDNGSTLALIPGVDKYEVYNYKHYKICPICKKRYYNEPALSRNDNKTKICSNCSIIEALNVFYEYKKKTNK